RGEDRDELSVSQRVGRQPYGARHPLEAAVRRGMGSRCEGHGEQLDMHREDAEYPDTPKSVERNDPRARGSHARGGYCSTHRLLKVAPAVVQTWRICVAWAAAPTTPVRPDSAMRVGRRSGAAAPVAARSWCRTRSSVASAVVRWPPSFWWRRRQYLGSAPRVPIRRGTWPTRSSRPRLLSRASASTSQCSSPISRGRCSSSWSETRRKRASFSTRSSS